jgi:hypothetical protein
LPAAQHDPHAHDERMRHRPSSWLVRGPLAALAASTAYGVVAVALQVPLAVVDAAAGAPAGPGVHRHHHPDPASHADPGPAPSPHEHFDCCVARLASSGAPAVEPIEPPAPNTAAQRTRWHPRLQPPRPRPWRASLGRHPPVGDEARLAR